MPGKIPKEAQPWLGLVAEASAKYGVPQDVILAVMQTESRFKPNAHSPTGVKGLMQVTQGTYKDLGFTGDRANPRNSIMAGAKYLGQLHKKYGNWDDAFTAYNGGGHGVTGMRQGKWGVWAGKPGKQKEIRNYARTVNQFRAAMTGAEFPTSYPSVPTGEENAPVPLPMFPFGQSQPADSSLFDRPAAPGLSMNFQGQDMFAVPENESEVEALDTFKHYGANLRGKMVQFLGQLEEAEKSRKPLFSDYPTYFDDRILRLIDETEVDDG